MKRKHIILIIIAALIVLLAAGGLVLVREQNLPISQPTRINIPQGTDYAALVDSLDRHGCIVSHPTFHTLAHIRGLHKHVKAGSYLLQPGSHIIQVIQKIYNGNQDPIRITINKHRTPEQLCQFLSTKLTFSPDSLLSLLQSDDVCSHYGETPQTIIGMFLQNTYEIYWTISPKALLDRMKRESDYFWDKRQIQLQNIGLTRQQVMTIASIVEEETNVEEEKPDIASVYLNRFRIGMPLQADPTVKYAIGDFTIRRILNNMLSVDSPYNTYRYAGLPPGPICVPTRAALEAVLNPDFGGTWGAGNLYFCANPDFSGTHVFAKTLSEHNRNAQAFQAELNRRARAKRQ